MTFSIASIIARMFASATPLALGAVGGLFGERSGITNLGLEGTMAFSGFGAAVAAHYLGNPWLGLLFGVLTGMLVALMHAFFCVTLKVNHNIIGLAVNILAGSSTVYISSILFNNKGYTAQVEKLPQISIPVLKDIPAVAEIFTNISVLTPLAIFVAVVAWLLLYKTRFGLHVISAGEAPGAAFVMGVKVNRVRYIAVLLGGLTSGLAGAYMSISYMNMFVKDMVSGRGFIAIAAILFGRYNPAGVFFAALFFGLTDAVQMALQGTVNIPNEVVQCIPYILTIAAVAFNEAAVSRKRKQWRKGDKQ